MKKLTHSDLIEMHKKACEIGRACPDFATSYKYFKIAARILGYAIAKSLTI